MLRVYVTGQDVSGQRLKLAFEFYGCTTSSGGPTGQLFSFFSLSFFLLSFFLSVSSGFLSVDHSTADFFLKEERERERERETKKRIKSFFIS